MTMIMSMNGFRGGHRGHALQMTSHILCATIKLKTACYHNICKNCNLQHVNDVINLPMSASKKPVNVIILNNAL